MARFFDYMKLSSDPTIAKFRTLNFRLVGDTTEHQTILESIDAEHMNNVLGLQKSLNEELKKLYKGRYKFDLCIDEGLDTSVLKIKRKQTKKINILCHEVNDKLSKIKKNIEISLSQKTDM